VDHGDLGLAVRAHAPEHASRGADLVLRFARQRGLRAGAAALEAPLPRSPPAEAVGDLGEEVVRAGAQGAAVHGEREAFVVRGLHLLAVELDDHGAGRLRVRPYPQTSVTTHAVAYRHVVEAHPRLGDRLLLAAAGVGEDVRAEGPEPVDARVAEMLEAKHVLDAPEPR